MIGRGGGRETVQNIGVGPQLQVMERFGELMSAERLENLCYPKTAYVRKIWLWYHSKRELVRQCTRSH